MQRTLPAMSRKELTSLPPRRSRAAIFPLPLPIRMYLVREMFSRLATIAAHPLTHTTLSPSTPHSTTHYPATTHHIITFLYIPMSFQLLSITTVLRSPSPPHVSHNPAHTHTVILTTSMSPSIWSHIHSRYHGVPKLLTVQRPPLSPHVIQPHLVVPCSHSNQ